MKAARKAFWISMLRPGASASIWPARRQRARSGWKVPVQWYSNQLSKLRYRIDAQALNRSIRHSTTASTHSWKTARTDARQGAGDQPKPHRRRNLQDDDQPIVAVVSSWRRWRSLPGWPVRRRASAASSLTRNPPTLASLGWHQAARPVHLLGVRHGAIPRPKHSQRT